MSIRCVIVDDEPLAVEVLKSYLKSFPNFEVLALFTNSDEALHFLIHNTVDVLFIDISLPMMSGFELINQYDNKNNTQFIVTTAYREFAAECYDLDVLDYLLKPIPIARFIRCIHKIESVLKIESENPVKNDFIVLKVDKKLLKLPHDEILFIEGMKEYVKVVTDEKIYITHRTLTSISEELSQQNFFRVHKSFTVSLKKINAVVGNVLHLSEYKIPIGRKYIKELKSKILE